MSCKGLTGKALIKCRTQMRNALIKERTRKRDSAKRARYKKLVLSGKLKINEENSFYPDTAKVNAAKRQIEKDRQMFLKEEKLKKNRDIPLPPTKF